MNNLEDRPVGETERELAREFMHHILIPESKDSPELKFVDDWKEKAESFIVNAKGSHDQDTVTALLAILVNASKALCDQVDQNPSSPIRNVAYPLFDCIKVLAFKYSTTLREAVEEKKAERLQGRVEQGSNWTGNESQTAVPPATSSGGRRNTLLDVMASRKKDSK
jgi:hypothetical protein